MSKLIKLYRYEHPDTGRGPYNSNWKLENRLNNVHYNLSHPTYDADGLPRGMCFITSLKGLKKWFTGWNKVLVKNGFIIKEFIVNSEAVHFGNPRYGQAVIESEDLPKNTYVVNIVSPKGAFINEADMEYLY